jgi:hypothetical protein
MGTSNCGDDSACWLWLIFYGVYRAIKKTPKKPTNNQPTNQPIYMSLASRVVLLHTAAVTLTLKAVGCV